MSGGCAGAVGADDGGEGDDDGGEGDCVGGDSDGDDDEVEDLSGREE